MKVFEVQLRYRDRNEESKESTVIVDASSLPGAVAKAAREFVKSLDRKQRFDMNKNGLEITAKSSGAASETEAKKSTEATAGWPVTLPYGSKLPWAQLGAGQFRMNAPRSSVVKSPVTRRSPQNEKGGYPTKWGS
jgi:hypothetical protein